jgi:hypothetical protein
MRSLLAAVTIAATLCGVIAAQAEQRIFIIANNPDGYGVDRCLASGATCGVPIATAYCQARDFNKVASFHKVERQEITGAVPATAAACKAGACEEFVAIECSR